MLHINFVQKHKQKRGEMENSTGGYMVLLIMVLIVCALSYICLKLDLVKYQEINEEYFTIKKREMNIYSGIACACIIMLLSHAIWSHSMVTIYMVKRYILLSFVWPILYIDLKTYRVPNLFIKLGLLCRVCILIAELLLYNDGIILRIQSELMGLAILGVLLLLCNVCAKDAIGYGDIKLLLLMCLYLGVFEMWNVLMIIMVLAFVVGIVLLAMKKKNKKDAIPFAPVIVIGTFISILIGG